MAISFTLIILLLGSAFFSGSETALFSLSKIRVKRLQLENTKNSGLLAQLLNRPRRLIISILIGNMLANIMASTTASSFSMRMFGDKGIGISIVCMTLLILIVGEITPKVIAIRNSEKISLAVIPYVHLASKLFFPIKKILHLIVNMLTPLFAGRIKAQRLRLTEEELRKAVELGRREGVLGVREEEMIKGVFKFGDKTAKDVIIPPRRIVAVDISTPLSTIRSIITKKELSRMPVFEERLHNIVGVLYAKDLIIASQKGPFSLREILREPFYVDENIKLDELLKKFRTHRVHMALVKNSKGKLLGLVTLQDLLEEIMGQIRDIKEGIT
ncbi:MAG: HlyC/CorC family transporter [Candidatus Omnitrophica bacterium]|nr:HlyC/CorC family transporter [Candidatus Omnitrophota bacterium]